MSEIRLDTSRDSILVGGRRSRQTPKVDSTFRQVLRGGAQALLVGAETATRAFGSPVLSAAVAGAQSSVGQTLEGSENVLGQVGGSGQTSLEAGIRTAEQQNVQDELKLIALQSEIQRQNREINLVSNLIKARHETAKAAIGNIRA